MNIYTIIIAVSLSIDATVVSIANSCHKRRSNIDRLIKLPLAFGIFQALMPILGYILGNSLKGFFVGYEHIIGAVLLFVVGIKMIYESIVSEDKVSPVSLSISIVLILAVATSIDAFSVGASFAFIRYSIYMLAILSGVITFITSFIGICVGRRIKSLLGERAEIASGIVLLLLGIKILTKSL